MQGLNTLNHKFKTKVNFKVKVKVKVRVAGAKHTKPHGQGQVKVRVAGSKNTLNHMVKVRSRSGLQALKTH